MATIEKRKDKKGEVSYRVKIRMLGFEHQTATFPRLTDAKKWAQDTESAMRDGRYFKNSEAKKHTLGDAIDKYIRDVLPHKSKSAQKTSTQLLWWKEQIGFKLLSDLSSSIVGELRDKLLKEPVKRNRTKKNTDGSIGAYTIQGNKINSPATVVRYMAALSVVLSEAVKEWKWMQRDQNPMPDVKKPKEPKGRVRFLSDEERDALLAACKVSAATYLYAIVVVAISTGMRYGEIMKVTWDDVDFQRRRIILHETKNGERRSVPLVGVALEELKRISKIRRLDTKLVFPGKKIGGGQLGIQTAWRTALKTAGIENFRFHDLRHCTASYLAMNGASLAEIAEVLGHKTLQMVKRYAHLSESHTTGVVERMNEKIFGC